MTTYIPYGNVQLAATVEVDNVLADALHDSSPTDWLYIPVPRNTRRYVGPRNESEDWISKHLSVSTSYNHLTEH